MTAGADDWPESMHNRAIRAADTADLTRELAAMNRVRVPGKHAARPSVLTQCVLVLLAAFASLLLAVAVALLMGLAMVHDQPYWPG